MRDMRRFDDIDAPLGFAFMFNQDMNAMTNYVDFPEIEQLKLLNHAREKHQSPELYALEEKLRRTDRFWPPRRGS